MAKKKKSSKKESKLKKKKKPSRKTSKSESKKNKKKENKKKSSESKEKKVSFSLNKASLENFKESVSKAWKGFRQNKILFNVLLWLVVFFVSLVLVDYAVQYLNYHASAVVVNGERIYRGEFYDKLEESYGETVVSQMIDEKLIYQQAEKENVEIDEDDINKEIEQLEKDYGGKDNLEKELETRGTSRDDLRSRIETVLIVQEILGKDIELSEEEKKSFYDEYKDVLFPDNDNPTYEEAEETIEDILIEQKVSQKLQPWLADLKSEANIQNNVEKPKDYELLRITKAFINDLIEKTLPEEEESEK